MQFRTFKNFDKLQLHDLCAAFAQAHALRSSKVQSLFNVTHLFSSPFFGQEID